VNDPEPLLAFWRAQDALFERIEPAWWGEVVSDARYPTVQEANYARVETAEPVGFAEIEDALRPALGRSRSRRSHVVVFRPEEQTDLIAEASTRGERITFDLVMVVESPETHAAQADETPSLDAAFWSGHRSSLGLFDIHDEHVLDQLQAIERDIMVPAGRRWFVRRDDRSGEGCVQAFAALLVLEGVGYLDHVVTVPDARRRGHAEALARTAVAEAAGLGAERIYLLAEPDSPAIRIYERVGFERAGHLASWLSPLG
jgi:ribosomal protein S18 acetylase RimI-like enzyme